jgi:CheY-like chemotaxis protein
VCASAAACVPESDQTAGCAFPADMKPSPRILIVEDETRTALAIQRGLQSEGYTASIAQTGPEGLKRLGMEQYDEWGLVCSHLGIISSSSPRCTGVLRSRPSLPVRIVVSVDGADGVDCLHRQVCFLCCGPAGATPLSAYMEIA